MPGRINQPGKPNAAVYFLAEGQSTEAMASRMILRIMLIPPDGIIA